MSKRYILFVTYACNWNCPYCITNTHAQPKINFDDVMEEVKNIENNTFVSISGGEPGMLSEKQLNELLDALLKKSCKIQMNTNGTVFKYKSVLNKIHWFLYHCSENLNNKLIPAPVNNVNYVIVVTDDNLERFDGFMQQCIDLGVRPCIHGADTNGVGAVLNKIQAIKLYMKYKDVIDESSKNTLLDSVRKLK